MARIAPAKPTTYPEEIRLWRDSHGCHINLPRSVVHHAPAGFHWGYSGAGPADLALLLLQHALEHRGYFGPTMQLYRGKCFKKAWRLHQDFKRAVIAQLQGDGPHVLQWDDLDAWIDGHADRSAAGV